MASAGGPGDVPLRRVRGFALSKGEGEGGMATPTIDEAGGKYMDEEAGPTSQDVNALLRTGVSDGDADAETGLGTVDEG
jgi:hypothetical protein